MMNFIARKPCEMADNLNCRDLLPSISKGSIKMKLYICTKYI